MDTAAIIIGYAAMVCAAGAVAFGLLYVCMMWWEWNVTLKNMKFDGRGNIVPINKP